MKKSITLFMTALAAISCMTEPDSPVVADKVEFQAAFGAPDSKALLKPGTDESKVEWNKGDKVSVLVGNGNYLYTADSDGAVTRLVTEADDVPLNATYYALYPYDTEAALADGKVTTSLPAAQNAVRNSFTTHIAVAQSTDNSLAFKNVCGLVKVTVEAENVTKIVFEGNSDEVVAGSIAVTVSDTPSWEAVAEHGATSVTLLPAQGQSSIAEGDYFFAVLPQTFEAGFKVTAYKGDDAWVIRNVTSEVTIARTDIVAGKPFLESAIYPVAGGPKTKTLQTSGDFTEEEIREGMIRYHLAKTDDVTGAAQNVNVLEIDLDNPDYTVSFSYGSKDSTSAVAERAGAIAAINSTYEVDAVYIRTGGVNHKTVDLESGHLRYWKHNAALVGDGERRVGIINGAGPYDPASDQAGDHALELYSRLSEPNIFASAPILIDDYEPVGASYVPSDLNLSQFEYEDYRRHQGVRHPRTAVAVTEDNDLLLIVVDGRVTGEASGMSARELTLFIQKHFNPRWAINMDGGGSSTMYLRGYGNPVNNVINILTEEDETTGHVVQRQVPTHLLVKCTREEGTELSPYLIKTPEDMIAMRQKAVTLGTTYFRLENDIDMSSVKKWTPVNYDQNYTRQIHFDGNDKTISNFAPEAFVGDDGTTAASYPSLFGVLYGSCKDLKIDNVTINSDGVCGVIGGYVGTSGKPGLVDNVHVTGAVVQSTTDRAGGICGNAREATFNKVSFQGSVSSTFYDTDTDGSGTDTDQSGMIGGFVGRTQTSAIFTSCKVIATVSGADGEVGGFVGKVEGITEFTDCEADVTAESAGTDLGGFAGKVTGTAEFTGCDVKAKITSKAPQKNRVGGLIGWNSAAETTITDCHVLEGTTLSDASGRTASSNGNYGGFIGFGDTSNTVLIISNSSSNAVVDAGSFANYASMFIGNFGYVSTVTITGCSASGSVKGNSNVGGIVGEVLDSSVDISNSSATGSVTGSGNYVGGVIGRANSTATIAGCGFDGQITGTRYVGGIVGGIATSGEFSLERTYSTGTISASDNYVGGLIGAAQGTKQTVENCWSSILVTAQNAKQVGGLVGTATAAITITDSYACGDIKTKTVGAGIIGRVEAADSKITGCIAWNGVVEATDDALTGAIVSSLEKSGTYSNCMRKSDIALKGSSGVLAPAEDEDITTVSSTRQYHGKAAAAGATLSSVAQSLGWSSDVWDFSEDIPTLKPVAAN